MCVCPLLLLLIFFMYAREEAVSHGHIPVNAEGRDEPSAAAVRVLGILPLVFHRLTTHPSPFWSKSKAFHWFCEGWNSSFSPVFFLSPTNISDSLTRTAAPLFCSSDFNDSIRHSSIFFFEKMDETLTTTIIKPYAITHIGCLFSVLSGLKYRIIIHFSLSWP